MEYTDKQLKLKEKVEKKHPDFAIEAAGLSLGDLDSRILSYAKHIEITQKARDEDEALNKAKDEVKMLNEPYKDTLTALKEKISYLYILMMEQQ